MATTVNTNFESTCLTANLPEVVEIETDAARLEVNIFVDSMKVFKSVYYPYNNVVSVRDIRAIVEASMFERQLVMASLEIKVYEPANSASASTTPIDENGNYVVTFDSDGSSSPHATVNNVKLVYCRYKTGCSSGDFLSSHFLTSRKSSLLPRNGKITICNHTNGYVMGSNFAKIYYSVPWTPGQMLIYNWEFGKMQSTSEAIITSDWTYDDFKETVNVPDCTVHMVEYQIGPRSFNIFFTDEEATDVFKFVNAFNIEETAFLFNTTTVKTEVDRSEAVCGNRTQFYDETIKVKHEVETAPLTYDEAMWLNQMLTSKLVKHPMENGEDAEVLISDIASEITDADKELIRLKFSWKYADSTEWI